MWEYRARDPEAPVPCPYALELRAIAKETIFSRVTKTTSREDFTRAQQSLLSLYQALSQRMQRDTFHFPSPRTGRHRCLTAEYEETYHRLINLSLMRDPAPAPPASQQPPLTPDDVVNNLRASAEKLRRPRDTYLR
jgi:hypothetical protein